jgi:hypothetical protein
MIAVAADEEPQTDLHLGTSHLTPERSRAVRVSRSFR